MSFLYRIFFQTARFWIGGMLLLVALTLVCATRGIIQLNELAETLRQDTQSPVGHPLSGFTLKPTWDNYLYETIRLFSLDSELARFSEYSGWVTTGRWLGAFGWLLTVLSVLIRLFRQRAAFSYVWLMTRLKQGHIIFAGLGTPEEGRERLAIRLSEQGHDVIVLEPNASHPSLDSCRSAGVICLHGSAAESLDLRRASVSRSRAVIALGSDDAANMNLLAGIVCELGSKDRSVTSLASETEQRSGSAERLSNQSDAKLPSAEIPEQPLSPIRPGNVALFQQVSEPGLMEVLKRHAWHRDRHDRLQLRIFNPHEMAARAMLRESVVGRTISQQQKILIVGTGATGRMAEALVIRAIKDQRIDFPDAEPLEIHVIDSNAENWAQCLSGRAQFLGNVSGIYSRNLPASRCGFLDVPDWNGILGEKFDAVFICLADESLAVTQAGRVVDAIARQASRLDLQPRGLPVVVRVREEDQGFGRLLKEARNVDGVCVRPVGLQDRVFDAIASMNPVVEMLAQVSHQDYLARQQARINSMPTEEEREQTLLNKRASLQPWTGLSERLRESNRDLVRRYPGMLSIPDADGRIVRRFHMEFAPDEIIDPRTPYSLNPEELERLARMEHDNWYIAQYRAGWRYREQSEDSDKASARESQSQLLAGSVAMHRRWLAEKKAEGRNVTDVEHFRTPEAITFNENMCPWDELSEGMKAFDFGIIQRLPYVLAKADYKLVESSV
ncbi:MAG: NAD-binding protein [Planctomycetaceae bacterium]|nr:NAD-binding protein [Planctomycetaceae bacterium]